MSSERQGISELHRTSSGLDYPMLLKSMYVVFLLSSVLVVLQLSQAKPSSVTISTSFKLVFIKIFFNCEMKLSLSSTFHILIRQFISVKTTFLYHLDYSRPQAIPPSWKLKYSWPDYLKLKVLIQMGKVQLLRFKQHVGVKTQQGCTWCR